MNSEHTVTKVAIMRKAVHNVLKIEVTERKTKLWELYQRNTEIVAHILKYET